MVASHTWSHTDLTTLSFDQIHNEMLLVEQAFERILGVTPAFMRPPFGNYNDLVQQVAYQHGQKLVLWDFDSGDSTGSTPEQSDQAYDALIKARPSTILPLNHEVYGTFIFIFYWELPDESLFIVPHSETTAHIIVPYVLKALNAAGYKMVTLAECLNVEPYQRVTSPQPVSIINSHNCFAF